MAGADPDEDGLADDVIGEIVYEAPMPSNRPFLPWHRPRKQFVRDKQWCGEIQALHKSSPISDGILKYLGLPGTDLLDLRHFHSAVCDVHDLRLRFLGFNSSARPTSDAHTELNVSLDEVRRMSRVEHLSDVIGDDFSLLANERSIAFRRAKELGPFDVINLDLCDGFGAQPPSGALKNSYYDAVAMLFTLQSYCKQPWLFLLTTRADKPNINADVLNALIAKYLQNLQECEPFRTASRDCFNVETEDALQSAIEAPDGLLAIFLTGLCKWLATLALKNQPPPKVEVRSVIGYSVDKRSEHEDLVSIAIRFTPSFTPAKDPLGLANNGEEAPDECKISTRALKAVAKRINADAKLAENAELHQAMVDATAQLLALARYDAAAYRLWVANG
jgi:hypothetical protein